MSAIIGLPTMLLLPTITHSLPRVSVPDRPSISCTPAGVQEMLGRSGTDTRGKECVIVGSSNIVGKPMMALMVQNVPNANATVTVCHSATRDLKEHTLRADILIVAAGKPRMVTGDMVKEGAVVIDVGINRVADASAKSGFRLVGDVDFESARERCLLYTSDAADDL